MRKPRPPVLVVGATGQLGSRIVGKLAERGERVRAFVRAGSRHQHLVRPNVELVWGDLRDAASVDAACNGARAVVATANSVAPRGSEGFSTVEDQGYATLLDACRRHRHQHVVFVSAPVTPVDEQVPLFRWKRETERRLQASGLACSVFRADLFMDDWFVFIGSRIPARGDAAALILREWDFLQRFVGVVGDLIERRGMALIPGSPKVRHAFVTVDDVAEIMTRSVLGRPPQGMETIDIGGPQLLSWAEVAEVYARALKRPVRAIGTPSFVFRAAQWGMRPFSEQAANIMGLNWVAGRFDTLTDGKPAARRFDLALTNADVFLRAKAQLPPDSHP